MNIKRIKKLKIVDIDGCLLNSEHRILVEVYKGKKRINLDHWRDNSHLCIQDELLPLAAQYAKMLQRKDTFVIIATSRIMSALDYQVIEQKLGKPHAFVSRIADEQKADFKFKGCLHIINELGIIPEEIEIFDDNIDYLKFLSDGFFNLGYNVKANYIPSNQGF